MKKIIPFKKDIIFKTNIAEITSISLDHTLHMEENNSISGDFTVSGDYKMTEASIHVEPFSYNLPFDISIDEKYEVDQASIDINDFYYEIVNENVLSVNIEVVIDGLNESLILEQSQTDENEEVSEELEPIVIDRSFAEATLDNELLEPVSSEACDEEVPVEATEVDRCIEPEDEKISSLFDAMDDSVETYQSYKVYIVRDGDTLETILEKYNITKEELESYNEMKEIHIGDKMIIPTVHA